MTVESIEKRLKNELERIKKKADFFSDLKKLLDKHGYSTEQLLSVLSESSDKGAVISVPKKAKVTAKKAAKPASKKKKPRALRKFKHPTTGEVAQSRAPQVDKKIKGWAAEIGKPWQELEI